MSNDTTSITPTQPNPQFHIFNFNSMQIRAFLDENGASCFIASDVCKALEIANTSQAVNTLDNDERGLCTVYTPSMQQILYVTEAGLYSLTLRSRKDVAKDFKRWVTHDVLPQIRKTGNYINPNISPLDILKQMVVTLENQQTQIANHEQRLSNLESHTQRDVEYFTIMGYYNKERLLPPSLNEAQRIGMRAAKLSQEKGYSIGKTSDPRFGRVNTYHCDILDEITGKAK